MARTEPGDRTSPEQDQKNLMVGTMEDRWLVVVSKFLEIRSGIDICTKIEHRHLEFKDSVSMSIIQRFIWS